MSEKEKHSHDASATTALFHFQAEKAGMGGLDYEEINKKIYEASKDSEYFKRQVEKKEKNEAKVAQMLEKMRLLNKDKKKVEKMEEVIMYQIESMEKERRLKRTWVHFDLDMFYVACEIRDRPELKEKPVAVGGIGMISTSNYIARKFGVRSAMPGFIAKRLCPDLILIPCNFKKYEETSAIFKSILREYDPELESMGLDEANLDITDYLNDHNISSDEEIYNLCHKIRMRINEQTKITVSCGIACNRMLAKICSDQRKPNGQFLLPREKNDILLFMRSLSVRKIPGIGNMTEQLLQGLGIKTCGDILESSITIKSCFTENAFDFLMRAALGIGRCYHDIPEDRKSVSVSRTFPNISKNEEMFAKLKELSGMLAEDLYHYKKLGKHLCVTLKTYKFEVRTRNLQLDKYINSEEDIYHYSCGILRDLLPSDPVRLMGIRMSDLMNESTYTSSTIETFFKKGSSKNVEFKSKSKAAEVSSQESNADSKSKLLVPKGKAPLAPTKITEHPSQEDEEADEKKSIVYEDEDELIDELLRLESSVNFSSLDPKVQEELLKNIKKPSKPLKEIDHNVKEEKRVVLGGEPVTANFKDISVVELDSASGDDVDTFNFANKNPSIKKSDAPLSFTCFICCQEVDCGGNSVRMNNHIDKCLKKQSEAPGHEENSRSRLVAGLPDVLVRSKKRAAASEIVQAETPKVQKRGRKPKSANRETGNIANFLKR